jgi:hypothetical protein
MQKNGNENPKKKMPIWIKRLLLVFGIVILLGGSYVIYLLKFKEYDVADSEVTEITRETFNIELPDGSTIELDEDGNIVESDSSGNTDSSSASNSTEDGGTESSTGTENSPSKTAGTTSTGGSSSSSGSSSGSGGTSSTGENESSSGNGGSTGGSGGSSGSGGSTGSSGGSSGNGGSTGSNGGSSGNGGSTGGNGGSTSTPPSNDERVTVASIKDKYEPVMSSLQGQASSRVDALVGRAYSEYQSKQANGESVNYAYFYNKYSSAAEELESRTDKVFYQVVGVIQKELKANNLAESHAQSFITQYEKEKEARRSALLDKAMNR